MESRREMQRLLRGEITGSKKPFVREKHVFLREKRFFPFTEEIRGSIPLRAIFCRSSRGG